jgi:hypothetical protein
VELLRRLGLEARVREKSLETYSPTGGIIAVDSLAERELATSCDGAQRGRRGVQSRRARFINQDALEPILRERALELAATVHIRTRPHRSLHHSPTGATAPSSGAPIQPHAPV